MPFEARIARKRHDQRVKGSICALNLEVREKLLSRIFVNLQ